MHFHKYPFPTFLIYKKNHENYFKFLKYCIDIYQIRTFQELSIDGCNINKIFLQNFLFLSYNLDNFVYSTNQLLHDSTSNYFFTKKVVQFINYYHYWEDSLTSKYVSHPKWNNKLMVLLFPNHEICQRFSCQIFKKKLDRKTSHQL